MNLKLGLYTISYSGAYYDGNALSLEDVIRRAQKIGYDGIEIEGKRPHGSPMDFSSEKVEKIKSLAEEKGIDICAMAAYNDFTSPVEEHREFQLIALKELIKLASRLSANIVRVFAGWQGITLRNGIATYDMVRRNGKYKVRYPSATELGKWKWVKEGLKEAVKTAEKYDVKLALQNHAPLIHHYQDVLDMIEEVDSNRLTACIDAPLVLDQSDEYLKELLKNVGELQTHSHFGGEFVQTNQGKIVQRKSLDPRSKKINYEAFIEGLEEIDYTGWLCYELCHPVLRNHKHVKIDEVDKQVEMAYKYISNLLNHNEVP